MSQPSLLVVPSQIGQGKLFAYSPLVGAPVEFGVTRATTAIRTNASGLLASVASGIARIDYGVTGCPTLLVEPSATNQLLRSEEFDNASWIKTNVTVSGNTTISPDGLTTADKIIPTITNDLHICESSLVSFVSGTTYTFSCFAKAAENTFIQFTASSALLATRANFNLASGTLGTVDAGISASISSIGNGWHRCVATFTAPSTGSFRAIISCITTSTAVRFQTFAGNAVNGIFIWGAQLETGSVATSYIPTVASTVTRNADVISKTGVSALIGQTEGTLYAEVDVQKLIGTRGVILILSDATNYYSVRTSAGNSWIFRYRNGGAETTINELTFANNSIGIFKIAFAYKNGDYAAAINGTVLNSTITGISPVGTFSSIELGTSPSSLNDRIRAAAIYKTRLSNAELAQLTSL